MEELLNNIENAYSDFDKAYTKFKAVARVFFDSLCMKLRKMGLFIEFSKLDNDFNFLKDLFEPILFACLNEKKVPVVVEEPDCKEERFFIKRFEFCSSLVENARQKYGYPHLSPGFCYQGHGRLSIDLEKGRIEKFIKLDNEKPEYRKYSIDCSKALQEGKMDRKSFEDLANYVNEMYRLLNMKCEFVEEFESVNSSGSYCIPLGNKLSFNVCDFYSSGSYSIGPLNLEFKNFRNDIPASQDEKRVEKFWIDLSDYQGTVPELISVLKKISFDKFEKLQKIADKYKLLCEGMEEMKRKYSKYKSLFEGAKILTSKKLEL